ncbi:PIG-L deacetylase family protein [Angustibacter luteus]|uniref:PIG-L deacetylase family protein n=1 Tax=Angustibacter luteus TaxID=658456 RepID=A0ABW1JGF0_9ACTN
MPRVLAVGAHPDDIEMGCGGTLAMHAASGAQVTMLVLTTGQAGPGEVSRRTKEAQDAADKLGARLIIGGLPDGGVTAGYETVQHIEAVIREVDPTIIYTHSEHDSHQDHRATAAATIAAGRQSPTIIHYQSPSSRAFDPCLFIDIEDFLSTKVAALACHVSQVVESSMVDLDQQGINAEYWGRLARCRYAEPFEITRVRLRQGGRKELGVEI